MGLAALGLDDAQVEALGLKNVKKSRKNKKNSIEELVLNLSEVQEKEVSHVVNALRRAAGSNQNILVKLLNRVQVGIIWLLNGLDKFI